MLLNSLLLIQSVACQTLDFFGSTNIKPSYVVANPKQPGVTDERILGAQVMLDMGFTSFKFMMTCTTAAPLATLMDQFPYKQLFDMPLKNYVFWVYPCGKGTDVPVDNPMQEYLDFFTKLKTRYKGTGKSFYCGYWEQDWVIYGIGGSTPYADKVKLVLDDARAKQQASDAAKTIDSDVNVFAYVEANLVIKSMNDPNFVSVANTILPQVDIDIVSYSAYDSQYNSNVQAALDYLQSKLIPRAGNNKRRVLIGEFGFALCDESGGNCQSDAVQADLALKFMMQAIGWGTVGTYWWQVHNNEVVNGVQRGFWLQKPAGDFSLFYSKMIQFKTMLNSWKTQNTGGTYGQLRKEAFRIIGTLITGGATYPFKAIDEDSILLSSLSQPITVTTPATQPAVVVSGGKSPILITDFKQWTTNSLGFIQGDDATMKSVNLVSNGVSLVSQASSYFYTALTNGVTCYSTSATYLRITGTGLVSAGISIKVAIGQDDRGIAGSCARTSMQIVTLSAWKTDPATGLDVGEIQFSAFGTLATGSLTTISFEPSITPTNVAFVLSSISLAYSPYFSGTPLTTTSALNPVTTTATKSTTTTTKSTTTTTIVAPVPVKTSTAISIPPPTTSLAPPPSPTQLPYTFAPFLELLDVTFDIQSQFLRVGNRNFMLGYIIPETFTSLSLRGMIYLQKIKAIVGTDGSLGLTFGGPSGNELALVMDESSLLTAYEDVISAFGVSWIDFHLEGNSLRNRTSIDLRNRVLNTLQNTLNLTVSVTFYTTPTGLGDDQLYVLNSAAFAGVEIDVVNLLTFNYGSAAAPNAGFASGSYAIQAATFSYSQIKTILPNAAVGITPMIGKSATVGEIFSLNDALQVTKWSKTVPWVKLLSFRTVDRDMTGKSGITQVNYAFARVFLTI